MTELKPGISYTTEAITELSVAAQTMGSGDMEVFATPAMIALMENAAMNAVRASLQDGYTTVGTFVCVSHNRAIGMGKKISATAVLTEIEGRSLTFDVTANDETGMIGEGTHKRFIVEREKFLNKLRGCLNFIDKKC